MEQGINLPPPGDLIAPDDLLRQAPPRPELIGLTPAELAGFLQGLGEPAYRARQLFQWMHGRAEGDFQAMSNLPAALRQRLADSASVGIPETVTVQRDRVTGTQKYLLRLSDGQTVETVAMPHPYGVSACISSQVGCRLGCRFCASTLNGLQRNLTAGEMMGQLLAMQRTLLRGQEAAGAAADPAHGRIGSVVFMGSGEPLENYEAVLRAVRLMHEPAGMNIGYRHISISTSGLTPAIRRLAQEGLPVTLALSLHAPSDALRSELMPINRLFPLAEVIAACKEYAAITGRRVTYEYLLLDGVNDGDEHADQLIELLHGSLAHVNLIPFNPVAERPYRRPPRERIRRFCQRLLDHGISATTRRTMGDEIDAACGQLRNRNLRLPAASLRPGQLPPPLRPARRAPPDGSPRS